MKIRTKLIFAFGAVTLMTLCVSLLGFLQTKKLSSALYEIAVVRLPSIQGLNTIKEAMLELNGLAGSQQTIPEKASEISQREKNALERLQEGWDLYEPLPQTKEEALKWKAFVAAASQWKSNYMASGESAIPRGTEDAARAEPFSTALRLLAEVMSINDQIAKDQKLRTIASYDDSVRVQQKMLSTAFLALVVAISVGLFLGRGITRPIAAITRSLASIGKGDLQSRINADSHDELGEVARATNRLADELSLSEARLQSRKAFLEAQVHSSPDGILVVDQSGKKILQNQRMLDMWNIPASIGNDPNNEAQFHFVATQVKEQGFLDRVKQLYEHPNEIGHDEIELKDGRTFERYSAPVLDEAGNHYGRIWAFRDITERKQAEERIHLLQTVTTDIAEAEDLPSAFRVVLQRLCEKTGWAVGHAWVVEQDGKHLLVAAAWVCGGPELEEFGRVSKNLRLEYGVSLPGMPLETGESTWVRDVTKHPLFPTAARRDSAIRAGIKAALAVPILSDGEVIAVLEFAVTEIRSEDPHLTKLTLAIATQIGLVIQRKRAEEMVRQGHQQLRALAGRLQIVREEERTRIAREIHDILAQELTRLRIDLGWMRKRVATVGNTEAAEPISEKLDAVINLTNSAIVTVQKIATELRPVVLDSLGLAAAIEWQAEEVQQRTGIQCDAIVSEDDFRLEPAAETNLFRMVQESLTNVIRHANATKIEIILERNEDRLLLVVQDNGDGFDPAKLKDPNSLGLAGMRERALMMDGQFEIRGLPGKGTQIKVTVPLKESDAPCSSNSPAGPAQ